LINLTNGEPIEGNAAPRWSPDGTHLLFCSNRDGDTELFIMDPNGENQVQLTNNGWTDNSASWSPDGRKIAYANSLTNYPQIHVMNRDGSYDFALTSSLTYNYSTDWRRR
jgi:Tol biopolymer transport system component